MKQKTSCRRYYSYCKRFLYLGENDNFHLSFAVATVFILNDFTDGVHGDTTRERVLNAIDMARNHGIHRGIFEGEITTLHRAVFQHETLAVAEGLCTDNVTIHKADILTVPCEVFTADFAIVNGDTVTVPEGILGIENAIVNYEIFTILEGVFSFKMKVVKGEVMRMEEGILALNG